MCKMVVWFQDTTLLVSGGNLLHSLVYSRLKRAIPIYPPKNCLQGGGGNYHIISEHGTQSSLLGPLTIEERQTYPILPA